MADVLLVPLDGSPLAERALPLAEALARATGRRPHLLRVSLVRQPPEPATGEAEICAAEEAYLARIAQELHRRGLHCQTELRFADAATGIVACALDAGADLLVMATHGRGGLGRWVYGSVAEAVLRQTPVPLLLVRAWRTSSLLTSIEAHPRLLVPLDGSRAAEAALPVAGRLARQLAGELLLVRAVPTPAAGDALGWALAPELEVAAATLTRDALDYLARTAERLRQTGVAVQCVARRGEPAAVIEALGQERAAALVVMATHGRTGLRRLALGSGADAVLRQQDRPLLLVRPESRPTGDLAGAVAGRAQPVA
jgi:nucleotide-binding universal stress UspA family protein